MNKASWTACLSSRKFVSSWKMRPSNPSRRTGAPTRPYVYGAGLTLGAHSSRRRATFCSSFTTQKRTRTCHSRFWRTPRTPSTSSSPPRCRHASLARSCKSSLAASVRSPSTRRVISSETQRGLASNCTASTRWRYERTTPSIGQRSRCCTSMAPARPLARRACYTPSLAACWTLRASAR
eukprot:1342024-Pleurochrysis_carterae.AAC.2